MTITRNQMRAGRILAGLTMRDLATLSGLSVTTIHALEHGHNGEPRARTLETVRLALESHGVQFTKYGWVRHMDDSAHPIDDTEIDDSPASFDAPSVLSKVAARMENSISVDYHHGALILRVLADDELFLSYGQVMECLRCGLLAQLGQEISKGTVTLPSHEGDAMTVASEHQSVHRILRALAIIGDTPIFIRQYRTPLARQVAGLQLETKKLERDRAAHARERLRLRNIRLELEVKAKD